MPYLPDLDLETVSITVPTASATVTPIPALATQVSEVMVTATVTVHHPVAQAGLSLLHLAVWPLGWDRVSPRMQVEMPHPLLDLLLHPCPRPVRETRNEKDLMKVCLLLLIPQDD